MTSPTPTTIDFIDTALLSLSAFSRSDHAGCRLDLGRNELVHPDLPALLASAITAAVHDIDGRYHAPASDLKRLAAALGTDPDAIELYPGSDDAIGVVLDALTRVHKRVLLQDPNYPSYAHYAHLHGIELRRWPPRPGELRYQASDATRAMRQIRPSVVVVTDPHGQLGRPFNQQEVDSLSAAAGANGHLLVVDQCYRAFAGDLAHGWPTLPHIVRIGTLSKSAGLAGLRLGYVTADPQIISYVRRWRHANAVSQLTIKTALSLLEDCATQLTAIRADVIDGRTWLADQITTLAPTWRVLPSAGNFLTIDTHDSHQAAAFVRALAADGILIRHHHETPAFTSLVQITAAPVGLLRPLAAQLAAFVTTTAASSLNETTS